MEARRYIGPHAFGLGRVFWKASEVVMGALREIGPNFYSLQRLSAAVHIAREAIAENVPEGAVRMKAVYCENRRLIDGNAGEGTDSGPWAWATEHRIKVRIWVDRERYLEAMNFGQPVSPQFVSQAAVVVSGIPIDHLSINLEGGWDGVSRAHEFIPGDITEAMEKLWTMPEPELPF